jgi:hypothetical protein
MTGQLIPVKYMAWVIKSDGGNVWIYIGLPDGLEKEIERRKRMGYKVTYKKVVG